MTICILNASNPKNIHLESDEYVDLRDRKSCFNGDEIIKQCRSWHSWAYCLETEFFVYNKQKWPEIFKYDRVIVLVNRDIQEVLPLIKKLKGMKKDVAIAYHEGVQDLIRTQEIYKIKHLQDIVYEAGTFINFIGHYDLFFKGLFPKAKILHIDHTNPFDWIPSYKKSFKEKTGDILIGTRTLSQDLSRNTLVTLATLSAWQRENPERTVDWICEDHEATFGFLKDLGINNINFNKGPLDYNSWLKFLSNYKYIVHHDLSMNLGQISLDALMLGVLPVGGTTWINSAIHTNDGGFLNELLACLHLGRPSYYKEDIEDMIKILNPDRIKSNLENF